MPVERAAARDRARPTRLSAGDAEDAGLVASIRAQLAPRTPGIERIPLLPALHSTFLAFDEVTQEQLTVIRRRAVLLLTRVCAAFARQFSTPDGVEPAVRLSATTPPSPPPPTSDTLEGTRKRKAPSSPDTPASGTDDSHDKQRRRTTDATRSEGDHPQAVGVNALKASLAEFLRAQMGTIARSAQSHGSGNGADRSARCGCWFARRDAPRWNDECLFRVDVVTGRHHDRGHAPPPHHPRDRSPEPGVRQPRPSPNSLKLVPQSFCVVCVCACVRCSLQAWLWDEVHPEALELLLAQLSPHAVFIGFLQVVGFDHLFLLDLLIGNETSFLAYLCQYLRHLTSHRHAFVATCFRIAAEEEDDDDDDGDSEGEEGMEGRVHGVLRRLHDTIERLDRKGLFPYRAKPLLTLLLQAMAPPAKV